MLRIVEDSFVGRSWFIELFIDFFALYRQIVFCRFATFLNFYDKIWPLDSPVGRDKLETETTRVKRQIAVDKANTVGNGKVERTRCAPPLDIIPITR